LVTHHALAPLGREEASRLLDTLVAGAEEGHLLRDRVLQRAGGVPFFLVSCAQGLQRDRPADRRDDVVPWTVAQGIRQRVAILPEATQQVLGVAAVVGRVASRARSEEHTSELQSQSNLVCRLLLEKKKMTLRPSLARLFLCVRRPMDPTGIHK